MRNEGMRDEGDVSRGLFSRNSRHSRKSRKPNHSPPNLYLERGKEQKMGERKKKVS